MIKLFLIIVSFITLLKLSFFPAYVSTDFEVHRNWLAITNSLPIKYWYSDNTSKWTLDYPPFFAWFEYALSNFAVAFDKNMTKIENLNYMSYNTRLFQKLTVIISDIIYIVSIFKIICCKPISKLFHNSLFGTLTILKLLGPFGLLFIDHIHFQYNGMLFGFLFFSIYSLIKNQPLKATFWFAVLLNFKHIYIYYAPAFGAYLFFHFCFDLKENDSKDKEDDTKKFEFNFKRFLQLGAVGISIFLISFGPFVFVNRFSQVMSRLFPFDSRGLTHAYWAPNIWAIYNSLDMLLSKTVTVVTAYTYSSSATRGLVEKYEHLILPSIKPLITLMLTVSSIAPSILKCRQTKSINDFLKILIISGWSAFIFGWHVHEKAILMVTLPFMFLEIYDRKCLAFGFYITTLGHYSLLPLVSTTPEYTLKMALFLACTCTHYVQISHMHGGDVLNDFSWWSRCHLLMMFPILIFTDLFIPVFLSRFQFLPLMVTSLYCGVGLVCGYIQFYLYYWTGDDKWLGLAKESVCSDVKKNQ